MMTHYFKQFQIRTKKIAQKKGTSLYGRLADGNIIKNQPNWKVKDAIKAR